MAKKNPGGRPAAFDVGSKAIRLPEDLAHMVLWLARIERKTAAQIIDPLARPEVQIRYAQRFAEILAIKMAEDAAAVASGNKPGPPLPEPADETGDLLAARSWSDQCPDEARRVGVCIGRINELKDQLNAAGYFFNQKGPLPRDPEIRRLLSEYGVARADLDEAMAQFNCKMMEKGEELRRQFPVIEEPELPVLKPPRKPKK